MPPYYHYTDDKGAEKIIRSGKIMASLKTMASDDAAFGNGVYLTELKPPASTKTQIALNNWMKSSPQFVSKTKNYFVIELPKDKVKDVQAPGRNIFLFNKRKDLSLVKFPWWLKDFDTGNIIASYKYTVASYGPALSMQGVAMGEYVMTDDTVNGRPVYECPGSDNYLFMDSDGDWLVGDDTGTDEGCLYQRGDHSLGPDFSVQWQYFDPTVDYDNRWVEDDVTLRAHPWQA